MFVKYKKGNNMNTLETLKPVVDNLEAIIRNAFESEDGTADANLRTGSVVLATDGDQVASSYTGNGPTILALLACFIQDSVKAASYDEGLRKFVNDCLDEAYSGQDKKEDNVE